jgi:hypothetical protein
MTGLDEEFKRDLQAFFNAGMELSTQNPAILPKTIAELQRIFATGDRVSVMKHFVEGAMGKPVEGGMFVMFHNWKDLFLIDIKPVGDRSFVSITDMEANRMEHHDLTESEVVEVAGIIDEAIDDGKITKPIPA